MLKGLIENLGGKIATEGMRLRMLLNFILITCAFSVFYALISVVIGFKPGVVIMLSCALLYAAEAFALIKKKLSYRTAANLYIVNGFMIAVLGCSYFSGGLFSPVAPWFTNVPVISLIMFGEGRNTRFWLVVVSFFALLYGVLSLLNFEFPVAYDYENYYDFFLMVSLVGLVLIIYTLAYIFEREKNKAQKAVEEKNKDILDSIRYAKRIQQTILPPDRTVQELLPESFIFYRPKDLVGGDFYWLESLETTDESTQEPQHRVLFAVADCTGHGVPGAFVSMICHEALRQAVRELRLTDPAEILNTVLRIVLEKFSKENANISDGMDIGLCSFCPETLVLEYAGAFRPLWYIKTGTSERKIKQIKGNKQPIGKHRRYSPFTKSVIQMEPGDLIYLFSDGIVDQFGGTDNRKLLPKRFRNFLLDIHSYPLQEQQLRLTAFFEEWQGAEKQTDDICVLGLRAS